MIVAYPLSDVNITNQDTKNVAEGDYQNGMLAWAVEGVATSWADGMLLVGFPIKLRPYMSKDLRCDLAGVPLSAGLVGIGGPIIGALRPDLRRRRGLPAGVVLERTLAFESVFNFYLLFA